MKKKHKPIYILHGWAIDSENEKKWEPVRALLQEQGIPTVFLPIPGLTVPLGSTTAWTLADYVGWLEGQLPKEKCILLGHSFGGQLAVRFTRQHPDRVAKLLLVASSGIRDHSAKATLKRKVFYTLAKIGKVFTFIPGLRGLLYKLAREKDYYAAPPVMQQTMSNILADEVTADLPKVSVPALVIWGSEDQVTPVKNISHFKKIPEVTVKMIAQARHSPQFTHPAQVAEAVAAYLESKK